jgi:hypothetical protein
LRSALSGSGSGISFFAAAMLSRFIFAESTAGFSFLNPNQTLPVYR